MDNFDFYHQYDVEEGQVVIRWTSMELTCWVRGTEPEVDAGKIFLKHLPEQATKAELVAICASVGPLTACDIVTDRLTGMRSGYAFATYSTPADAQSAWHQLNGRQLYGKRIKATPARYQSSDLAKTSLHIKGIPKDWTVRNMWTHFSAYGVPVSVKILLDERTGISTGVGILVMTKKSEAEMVKTASSGITLPSADQPLVVSWTKQHERKTSTNTWPIFVGNLSPKENVDFLRGLFVPFGDIHGIYIMSAGQGQPGFGFVNMRHSDEAFAAVSSLHNLQLGAGRYLTVQPKKPNFTAN